MSARSRLIVAALIVAVGVVLAIGLLRPSTGSSGTGGTGATSAIGAQPGQLAPLFESTDLNGHPIRLADYRGHRAVLNFWASWCVPCRSEFPVFKRLLVAHPDVVVLGIVFQDGDASARAFARAEGATWPAVRDPSGQIASAYGVHAKPGIPVSVLIAPSGHVLARQLGPLENDAAANAFIDQAVGK